MTVKINHGTDKAILEAGDTPTKQLTRQLNDAFDVEDVNGRKITLKKPNAIRKLRFIEALGESSSNRLWTGAVWPLMYVTAIDGKPVATPIAKIEMEALYERLGDDGMDAVSAGLGEYLKPGDEEVDAEAAKK